MKRRLSLLLLLTLTTLLQAGEGLPDVLGARNLLSKGTWSEVLHVVRRGGGTQGAPSNFYALIFEFDHILCLYSPFEGTRILSSEPGHTEDEKGVLPHLLRKQWPDLLYATSLASTDQTKPAVPPANACFVQSVAAWQRLAGQPGTAQNGVLLSYYWREDRTLRGHTVLLLDWEKQAYAVDLTRTDQPFHPIPSELRSDPAAIARLLEPLVTIDHIHQLPVVPAG